MVVFCWVQQRLSQQKNQLLRHDMQTHLWGSCLGVATLNVATPFLLTKEFGYVIFFTYIWRMEETITITQEEKDGFEFLNILRRSGATNMFGAAPYVADELGVDKRVARGILTKWMKHFNEDGYDHLEVVD